VLYKEIGSKTVVFAVYDFDRFGKHDIIGKIEVPLNSIDLGQIFETTKELEAADKVSSSTNWRLTIFSGLRETWRCMFFSQICSYFGKIYCRNFGGKELEENGRLRPVRSICQGEPYAKWQTTEEEENNRHEFFF